MRYKGLPGDCPVQTCARALTMFTRRERCREFCNGSNASGRIELSRQRVTYAKTTLQNRVQHAVSTRIEFSIHNQSESSSAYSQLESSSAYRSLTVEFSIQSARIEFSIQSVRIEFSVQISQHRVQHTVSHNRVQHTVSHCQIKATPCSLNTRKIQV